MRPPGVVLVLLLSFTASALATAESLDVNPQPLLQGDDFKRLKEEYQGCVMQRGSQLRKKEGFEVAVKYAPLACRRKLLQIKRLMLGSAFKVEVADDLLASIAEGVKIDLVIFLLEEDTR